MCNPMAVMAVAAVAGTAATVHGQQQAAAAAAETAQVQGQASATEAGQTQDAATAEAERIRAAARRQRAEAAAAYAGSGVSVGEGTPLKIDQEIARGGELDALNTIISGGRGADVLTRESAAFGAQASAVRRAAKTQSFGTLMSSGDKFLSATGWRANGTGYSGGQAKAKINDLSSYSAAAIAERRK